MKTLIGISVTVVIIMLPIEAVVQAHPNQERVYQNVSAHNRVHKGPACAFDTLPMEEKAVAWLDMSPRHRDFHWRAMSAEERQELKKHLPNNAKQAITHRYAPKHFYDGMSDVPTGWRKRLTNEERMILREQIVHAQKNLTSTKSRNSKTPAEAENDLELQIKIQELNERMHSECIMFSFSNSVQTLQEPKDNLAVQQSPDRELSAPKDPVELSASSAQPASPNQETPASQQ